MNTSYTDLINKLVFDQQHWSVMIPDDWGQGRTAFGGIVVAVMYEAVKQQYPTLPPLRSVHISFIGPASGQLDIRVEELRVGKNVSFIEAVLSGEKGLATKAIFAFGHALEGNTDQDYPKRTDVPPPEALDPYPDPPHRPSFLAHFERRIVKGPEFLSGTHHPDFLIWLRLREQAAHPLFSSLLALADAPPPAALAAVKSLTALSTMTWTLNMLRDNPRTDDGWWLMQTQTQHIRHGYSSQIMRIWNREGAQVIDAIQHVAIFE